MNNRMAIDERNIQRWLHRHTHEKTTPPTLTGLLIAVPFRGIGYRTATQSGTTNSKGEFRYLPGEKVTFFIADIDLPAANAGRTVTPYDMGTTHNEPINVIRLLYSVCRECDGTLSVPAGVIRFASSTIDFTVEPCSFAQQSAVKKMIDCLGHALVDEKSAVDRLDALIARYIYLS